MPPRNNENAKKAPAMETPKTNTGQDETPKFHGAAPAVEDIGTDFTFKHQIVWKNAIAYLGFHIVGLVGLLMVLSFRVNPLTTLYTIMVLLIGGVGLTMGAHSLAHIYGTRPYDKSILPVQSQFVSIVGIGEGWHNYHHAFPWDYRTSEYGTPYNFTAKVIDYCAKKGWVYDLKAPTEESIKNRVKKTGDNSHEKYGDPTKYSGVETWNNVWITPGNPTYTSKIKPQPIKITREYVLYDTDKKFE
uniref:Fatty acid desaturase domain-containing protein n=1 Tax=Lutzomyia longipalpis TaxID=7200 RepID=A0A1B0CSD3_LUTLO